MQRSMYKQKSLEDEILGICGLVFKQVKSFLYKHHTLLGYF